MSDYLPKRLIQSLLIYLLSIDVTYAITVTSVCDGFWSDSATWDLGVPSTSDSVAIYHNVRLDVPVVLNLPASLYISVSGELCGNNTLQCEFIADGPISAASFIIEGISINNAPLKVASSITVNGSWTINSSVCIGCAFTCPPILNPCSSPVADFAGGNTSICSSDCINFTDLSAGYPSSWQWSFPGATPSTSTAQHPSNICYPTTGTYDVTLVVTNINGSDSITQTIVVNSSPLANFTNTTVCQNEPTTFNDASLISFGSIVSWQWDFGDGIGTSTAQNPTYTYSNPGTFVVTLTVISDSGCAGIVGYPVEVFPLPVANFTTANLCLNDDAVFTDISTISSGSISSWLWDFGDGNTATAPTPANLYGADSTYNVTLVVTSDNNCTDTIVQPIQIYPIPVAGFSTNNVCLNDPAVFTDTSTVSSGSIVAWNWNFGDGTSTAQNPTHPYSADGTYNVSLIVTTINNCVDTMIQSLTIYPVPSAGFTTGNVCLSDAAVFTDVSTINPPDNIVSWDWNFGDGIGTSIIQNPSYIYGSFGLYSAVLTVTSNNNCVDVSPPLTIEIYPVPIAEAGQDSAICSGDTVMLNATGGISYSWNPSTGLSDPNISNPNANPSATITYSVTVTNSSGCQDMDSITITVAPAPSISGQVFDSIYPVTAGIVKLREYHSNPTQMQDIDSSYIDSLGYYSFSNIPAGQYLIIARADTGLYPDLVATYYDSTNHWQKAIIVSATCSDTITADIHLIDFPVTIGHGSISGKAHGGGGNKTAGFDNPFAGLDISLEKIDSSGVAGFAITDTLGRYSFENIPSGTYSIYVDVAGLVMDTTYTITITATDSVFSNLDFCIDTTLIDICDLSTVVFEVPVFEVGLKVYPNPYTGKTHIVFRLANKADISLGAYNILGAKIHTLDKGIKDKGDYHYTFSAQKLGYSSGIYLLRLMVNDKVYTRRLIEF